MALIRTELTAAGREEARRLLAVYRKGGREPAVEEEVIADVTRLGKTPRSRPRLAGTTDHNPPILLFDTDVEPDSGH
ncbi:MAG: hypothetical protein CMJ44_09245 [Pimelobacter sp.]|nr:hypothetical protein [Pimelobacter sp.]